MQLLNSRVEDFAVISPAIAVCSADIRECESSRWRAVACVLHIRPCRAMSATPGICRWVHFAGEICRVCSFWSVARRQKSHSLSAIRSTRDVELRALGRGVDRCSMWTDMTCRDERNSVSILLYASTRSSDMFIFITVYVC
jgi:hypothetical protein